MNRVHDRINESQYFDDVAVKELNELTRSTGSKIVVSSSWRNGMDFDDLKKMLYDNGVTGEVIGITPYLEFSSKHESIPRGCEIDYYVKKYNIEKYVIIDDDSDMLYIQKDKFIHVYSYYGFTHEDMLKAKNILK